MMSKQNVPELRFPEFSGEWEERTLENISNIYDGTHATPDYVSEGIPFFSVENVSRKDFVNSKYVSREAYEVYKKRVEVEFNDILMTRIGSIGNVKRVDWHFPSTFYVSLALLKLKKGFVPKYIEQLLKSPTVQKNIVRNSLVTAVPQKINLVDLKQVKINLATSKSEQLKIGEFLSKVDRLIELEEKKLELLEEQKKGYMQKIFSQELRFKDENGNDYPEWKEKILGDMGITYTGLSGKTKENFGIGDAQFITYKNVFNHLFADVSGIQQVEVEENEKQNIVRGNDILFTTSSETPEEVGMASIWHYETSNTYLNSFCFGYRLEDSEVSAEFLAISLRQEYMRQKITLLGQGSTRFNLSKREVMKLSVLAPCLQEQYKITDLYKKLMYRINMKKEKINSLKRRKRGLLQKLFI